MPPFLLFISIGLIIVKCRRLLFFTFLDSAINRRRNSSEEGSKVGGGGMLMDNQTLGLVDSKQNKELLDKIKDFNEASRELKEKSVGGSAPDLPRKDSMVSTTKRSITHFSPIHRDTNRRSLAQPRG